jgi:pimeloyl-ACP methyl ester carboxylesterase
MAADGGGSSGLPSGLASGASDVVRQVRDAAGSVVGDVAAGRWRRAGIVGVSLGVVAAGAAAGVAIERLSVGREMRRRAEAELDAAAAFGSLRGTPFHVSAPDGTDLYAELDGTGWAGTEATVAREAAARTAQAAAEAGERTGHAANGQDLPHTATGPRTVGRPLVPSPADGGSGPGRGVDGADAPAGRRGSGGAVVPEAVDADSGSLPAHVTDPAARKRQRRADGARPRNGGSVVPGSADSAAPKGRGAGAPDGPAGRRGRDSEGARRDRGRPEAASPLPLQGAEGAARSARGGAGGEDAAVSPRPRRLRGWLGRRRGGATEPEPGPLGGVLAGVGTWLGAVPTPPLTVVFVHGYCLNQDSWHFQREAFRDGLRLVFFDQRSHGRSERSRSHLAGEPASIDQLGGDLGAVIDAVAPTGPLVLVGHSMGGMTVMALADQRPELFAERVAGVALLGTTAGNWRDVTLGLPGVGAKMFHRVGPGVIKALGRQAGLVERGRRLSSELTAAVYHRFSFGTDDVDPARARFAQQLLEATPVDVVAEFFPAFPTHDKTAALAALRDLPTLVLAGDRDLLTPPAHSEAIAAQLPDAELEILPDTGHLLMLERPELVNAHLARLLERAATYCGAALPPPVHLLAEPADNRHA